MNKENLLSVRRLETSFQTARGKAVAVGGVSFDIHPGKTMALVGESGCGKSVTALSLIRLVQEPAGQVEKGSVLFQGKDLLRLPEKEMRHIRGNKISMIFQEPMTSLNPVMTIGEQIGEVARLHLNLNKPEARAKTLDMLDLVKIPDPERRLDEYPHQMSGGMKQRVMIAMALICEPDLLIADEPTTALDVTVQAQILKLMKELQQKKGTAILLITHDMGVVYEMADDITVMYAGQVVEQAERASFFQKACHPYTTKLFASLPERGKGAKELNTIPGLVPEATEYPAGCRFADRCDKVFDRCRKEDPSIRTIGDNHAIACHLSEPEPLAPGTEEKKIVETGSPERKNILLSVTNLKVHYPIRKGLFKKITGQVKAVDGIHLTIPPGETLALVGESGCGKTTAGKAIVRLLESTDGEILFDGINLTHLTGGPLRKVRKDLQIMFQDPYGSLNPRMMVGQIIGEGLASQGIGGSKRERERIIREVMERVGLNPGMIHRYPHEFSGGQRQRIGIARFLAIRPRFVVCDEVTSALDISVQAQILNLLKSLQREEELSYLFITHNLSVVSYMADKVAVMYLGKIVERGRVDEIFDSPRHPYTRILLQASPTIGQDGLDKIYLEGDVPSPSNPPPGCPFHPRCPEVQAKCREEYPGEKVFSSTHSSHCWIDWS